MFGASWFDELAGRTRDSRVEQPPVIWIDVQLAADFLLCHCACKSQEESVKKKKHTTGEQDLKAGESLQLYST